MIEVCVGIGGIKGKKHPKKALVEINLMYQNYLQRNLGNYVGQSVECIHKNLKFFL